MRQRPPDRLLQALEEARRTTPASRMLTPVMVATMIANGSITRDRSCTGKRRYHTASYAFEVADRMEQQEAPRKFSIYACPFCNGFHVTHYIVPAGLPLEAG